MKWIHGERNPKNGFFFKERNEEKHLKRERKGGFRLFSLALSSGEVKRL